MPCNQLTETGAAMMSCLSAVDWVTETFRRLTSTWQWHLSFPCRVHCWVTHNYIPIIADLCGHTKMAALLLSIGPLIAHSASRG